MADLEMGKVYDIYKSLYKYNAKTYTEQEMKNFCEQFKKLYSSKHRFERYFMLLCHELRDYTVFRLTSLSKDNNYELLWEELLEVLKNRGHIVNIEFQDDKIAVEFFVQKENEKSKDDKDKKSLGDCYAYYFFPYSKAVIEI